MEDKNRVRNSMKGRRRKRSRRRKKTKGGGLSGKERRAPLGYVVLMHNLPSNSLFLPLSYLIPPLVSHFTFLYYLHHPLPFHSLLPSHSSSFPSICPSLRPLILVFHPFSRPPFPYLFAPFSTSYFSFFPS